MKLNKIFMAFAAMAMVGCSSEDFNDFAVNQAIDESGLVQLDENFVLAGAGEDDATTRTHWWTDGIKVKNVFLPIYSVNPQKDEKLSEDVNLTEAVGLCWLGNGAATTDVYTNYEFYHFGWLKEGAKKAELDECGNFANGVKYDEITFTATAGAAGDEADPANFTLPNAPIDKSGWTLELNSGIYKTENKAIFGGKYVVYYPFNPDFKNAGTIPAVAKTTFDPVPLTVGDPELAKATFRYSTSSVDIEGGDQAANFGLQNLSTLVQLRINSKDDAAAGRTINQIVLYSAKEQLLKEVHLDASKIAAGVEANKGTDLYVTEGTKGTKTIVANATGLVTNVKNKHANAFITVLPTATAVEDLEILLHDADNGRWATVKKAGTTFVAGKAQIIDIDIKGGDFKSEFIAVDKASLLTALTEARPIAAGDNPVTIEAIGDIALTAADVETPETFNINDAKDKYITIKGGDIIVPEAVTLNLNTNMESDVRVLGKSCCSKAAYGGRLRIIGGTVNNVTMEPTEVKNVGDNYNAYNPRTTFVNAGTATAIVAGTFDVQAGNVDVNKAVQHKGNIKIAEGVTLTVSGTGDLQFNQPDNGKVENYGTIEVLAGGNFDMTDENGDAAPKDGKRMTNYKGAKFIHNVDAEVGTAVQSMDQQGEYRCKVTSQDKLNDAFLQWTACSVIEIIAGGNYNLGTGANINIAGTVTPYKHKDFIDFEVTNGAVKFTNPVNGAGNGDGKDIQVGNLTVKEAGTLDITYGVAAGKTGARKLTVNGDMVVNAATTMTSSQQIIIKKNLTVENAGADLTLKYAGAKANVDGLAVTGDIKVIGDGTHTTLFDASDLNALKITCANFSLENMGSATFGNRNKAEKNLEVGNTISNPATCTFTISAAVGDNLLGWVTCKKLKSGGSFPGSKPLVIE